MPSAIASLSPVLLAAASTSCSRWLMEAEQDGWRVATCVVRAISALAESNSSSWLWGWFRPPGVLDGEKLAGETQRVSERLKSVISTLPPRDTTLAPTAPPHVERSDIERLRIKLRNVSAHPCDTERQERGLRAAESFANTAENLPNLREFLRGVKELVDVFSQIKKTFTS
jgi:hypothetical protein